MLENDYIGRILDKKYKISRRLGDSGMGEMYLGENIENDAWVAVKFLRSDLAKDKESLTRFFREARATVQLRHKNIIKIYDVGITDESDPYLVMEYIEGESLSALIARLGKLAPVASLAIIEPILRAVGSMHKKGILHRGIKPENIHLVHRKGKPPRVKLTDFGLSKFTAKENDGGLTVAGITLGDFSYISPEQIKDSSSVDQRADLYSIGTIMYEMLTGKLPFSDQPEENRLSAKFTSAPVAPRQIAPSIPPSLESLVMRTLKCNVGERPASVDEMLYTIEGLKGFKDRAHRLGKATMGASRLTIAGGNFDIPSSVRKAPRSKRESDDDIDVGPQEPKWAWLLKTRKGKMILGGAAAGMVALLLAMVLIPDDSSADKPAVPKPSETPAAASPTAPSEDNPKEVQLEIRGVPSGAKIYYDGAPIPLNPFRVALKEVIVPLKIEADGYEPYTTSVVPAEDQVVRVEMKKAAPTAPTEPAMNPADAYEQPVMPSEPDPPQESERRVPPKRKSHGSAQGGKRAGKSSKKGDNDFVKLKNGVKVSDEFE